MDLIETILGLILAVLLVFLFRIGADIKRDPDEIRKECVSACRVEHLIWTGDVAGSKCICKEY